VELTYKRPKKINITYNIENNTIYLSSKDGYEDVIVPISRSRSLADRSKHEIDFHDACILGFDESTNTMIDIVKFSADVKAKTGSDGDGKILKNILLKIPKLLSRNLLVVKPMPCGAYLGPGNTKFREFMCHNLGEHEGLVSYPVYQGGKERVVYVREKGKEFMYAWGRKKEVNKFNDKENPNTYDDNTHTWLQLQDPCPWGYRIPTNSEWEDLFRYNVVRGIAIQSMESRNLGWFVGERLFFYKKLDSNQINMWTSTPENESLAYYVGFQMNENNFYIFKGESVGKRYGLSVRCMKNK